jgi:hypothetical protein
MAGSAGTQFIVNPDGTVIAKNADNGANSTNTAAVSSTNNNTTTQTNQANIVNNINLSANSGNNETKNNTGGDNSIKTGDANVMANILNFVNNNFKDGKVVISVVNVFGSWLGSFVPPGMEAPKVTAGTGGTNVQTSNFTSTQNSNSSSGQNGSSSVQPEQAVPEVETVIPVAARGGSTIAASGSSVSGGSVKGEQSGLVEEDNTITVPPKVQVAGVATSSHTTLFFSILGLCLALVIGKKWYQLSTSRRLSRKIV